MARDFHCGLKIAVYVRTVYVRRAVEPEGVIKCLTVRNLMYPGGCRKASAHTAAFSHFRHIGPSNGWVGCRRGVEAAPCLGCLRGLPPEGGVPGSREETAPCLAVRAREAGARAGLASAGRSADAPACGQAVGANLARTNFDLGRARWLRGNAKRMNGKAKGLTESRNGEQHRDWVPSAGRRRMRRRRPRSPFPWLRIRAVIAEGWKERPPPGGEARLGLAAVRQPLLKSLRGASSCKIIRNITAVSSAFTAIRMPRS